MRVRMRELQENSTFLARRKPQLKSSELRKTGSRKIMIEDVKNETETDEVLLNLAE